MSSPTAPVAGLTTDVLFLGATRPALAFGVPYAALLVNAFATLELFLLSRNLLSLVCAPLLHGTAWVLCHLEPRFFDLLGVWARARAGAGRGACDAYGVVSYGPFAVGDRHGAEAPAFILVDAATCDTCAR